jgi:hypothetical protein
MDHPVTIGMIVWPALGLLGAYVVLRVLLAIFGDAYKH